MQFNNRRHESLLCGGVVFCVVLKSMISLSALSGIQLMQNGTETTIALESYCRKPIYGYFQPQQGGNSIRHLKFQWNEKRSLSVYCVPLTTISVLTRSVYLFWHLISRVLVNDFRTLIRMSTVPFLSNTMNNCSQVCNWYHISRCFSIRFWLYKTNVSPDRFIAQ